ncbi:MAG: hypothetical protein KAR06_00760 [Deltaproteobacteria bacterium]|nr:hypothetical protein [Deltaproteobacteria bacterium]
MNIDKEIKKLGFRFERIEFRHKLTKVYDDGNADSDLRAVTVYISVAFGYHGYTGTSLKECLRRAVEGDDYDEFYVMEEGYMIAKTREEAENG